MKYLFINSVYGLRSTGKLVAAQCRELTAQGHRCWAACGRGAVEDDGIPLIRIGSPADHALHALETRLLDRHGFASRRATGRFLRAVEQIGPDVIWLHNLHGYYLHVGVLFDWLKRHEQIEVRWTLHDCWAFTGHCAYFTVARCQQWKSGCRACSQLGSYPVCRGIGRVKKNYAMKKAAFTGVKKLTLITPSRWLADLTRESFLREYPVEVVRNEIDTEIFRPRPSDFKAQNGLSGKFMILGVAVGWEETKGFPDVLALRKLLDERFVFVLVGLREKQIRELPAGILGITRTVDQIRLAELYTAADVFINPTHQDNYPTVNLEARACGTPVVTYDVGGSPESAAPENVVREGDLEAFARRIRELCTAEREDRHA